MPIRNAIWKVGAKPEQLGEAMLPSERVLEDMIVAAPRILSDDWMLIGRQEPTPSGGRIDLLAVAPDGSLVLIELKRDRTPREVVAQAIDYAVWVESLKAEAIAEIFRRFRPGCELSMEFHSYFGRPLDEDTLNERHQIVIVAASLDLSSERIVKYLNDRDIPINVLCFQVFALDDQQLISRSWLLDPAHTQVNAAAGPGRLREKEAWNGEYYASFGADHERDWSEAVGYGFISAGGGSWYTNTLDLLSVGDRVWVKAPGFGFVGVGVVTAAPAQIIDDFRVATSEGERPALDVLKEGNYHREYLGDRERCEWFVSVKWLHTVSLDKAVNETGLFGNQNTVCAPTTPKWRTTVDWLKALWGVE